MCIKFSLKHKILIKKKHIIFTCIFNWLTFIGYNGARFIATTKINNGICVWHMVWPDDPFWFDFVWILNTVIYFIFPAFILIFSNMAILLHIKKRNLAWKTNEMKNDLDQRVERENAGKTKYAQDNNKINKTEGKTNETVENRLQKNKAEVKRTVVEIKAARLETNVLKTLISVSVAFGLCWMWNAIWYVGRIVKAEFTNNTVYYDFSVMMMFCNCCVNPGLYAASYKSFQEQSNKLFFKVCTGEQHEGSSSTPLTDLSSLNK